MKVIKKVIETNLVKNNTDKKLVKTDFLSISEEELKQRLSGEYLLAKKLRKLRSC